MEESEKVIDEAFQEYKKVFGRTYQKLTPYRCDDADVIILAMGSMSGTARAAVDILREEGKKVGCIKMTVYRPFPGKELLDLTKNTKALAVLDRDITPGLGGALYADVAAQFVNRTKHPLILNYILGLGGRDIVINDFKDIYEKSHQALDKGVKNPVEWINLNKELL
jgi:pyruvate ferredoxin oxidoreductase alpha subunit